MTGTETLVRHRLRSAIPSSVAALFLVGCATASPVSGDTIRVRRLEVVDSEGRVRLVADTKDGPSLVLRDPNGMKRLALELFDSEDGGAPGIALFGSDGLVRLSAHVAEYDNRLYSIIRLGDGDGNHRISLVAEDDSGNLVIFDKSGKVVWSTDPEKFKNP